jgi:hypothetical protein
MRTAFFCHSHLDAELAKELQGYLHRNGREVYIDWEDATMPDTPDRRTAETRDGCGVTHGSEYLELYRHLDKVTGGVGSCDAAGKGSPLR